MMGAMTKPWRRLDPDRPLVAQVYGEASRGTNSHWNSAGYPKQAFPDEAAAQAYADHMFEKGGRLSRPYRCDECDEWHVGGVP